MSVFNIVVSTSESTVVTEYQPVGSRSDAYQSEAALERAFIDQLRSQGYDYLPIHGTDDLVDNLRRQLEKLNDLHFTDKEWKCFFEGVIANPNAGVADKTRLIQEECVQSFVRDSGATQNVTLLDKKNIHNNVLQVINQYAIGTGEGAGHDNRYDVTVLVNGFPLVHVELKRRGVALKEAFNQINRYQRESFWAGSGLYEYVQVFVISNGTHTKYYSNTTRDAAVKEASKTGKGSKKKTSNSFEFTSFWADGNNAIIPDLVDFTKTFFARHTLLNILTRYCVFTSEELLLVMRPYQIVATERILNRIETSTNLKQTGKVEAGGYIWHTTGSGKTLTSFKTAQLATGLSYIDKVLFVVDRKDLDYQTMREYDRFQKGAANGNRNTKILQKQLEDPNARIIVTTIQKLDVFIAKNSEHDIYGKHVVLIFDECHRSQFGTMHAAIVKRFKKYHIFGFTGTPIFAQNAPGGGKITLRTTEQTFGDKLHTYTIVDAINDGNVLPFRIDYVNTVKTKDGEDKQVAGIDTEAALEAPARIAEVVGYMLEHFDQKTIRNTYYSLKGQRVNGFNAIFATASIDMAKRYYLEFRRQMKEKGKRLVVATIFSFAPNEEANGDGVLDDESFDTEDLDASSREFLDSAIGDYNRHFHTNFDSSGNGFQDYYKDLSDRVKKREVDLLIVVNMFLTGFDATTLNTLWVDKNLKMHGLLQAFSRTNRILNSVKTFGNIVCFRDLEEEVDEAIALFGDKDAGGVVLLRTYADYYYGYDEGGKHQKGYEERIAELIQKYPLGERILGENAEKDFIVSFGSILRLKNILTAFDQFAGNEILRPIDYQDYTSVYLDLRDKYRPQTGEKENINDDLVFEIELVKQVEVNIDYILLLVAKFHASHCKDKEIRASIDKAIMSSLELRSKKELIDRFIESINVDTVVQRDWEKFVREQEESDLRKLIDEERLKEPETRRFIEDAFRRGTLKTTGKELDGILPAMSRFGGGNRDEKKRTVIEKTSAFFDRYYGLIAPEGNGGGYKEAWVEEAESGLLVAEGHDATYGVPQGSEAE